MTGELWYLVQTPEKQWSHWDQQDWISGCNVVPNKKVYRISLLSGHRGWQNSRKTDKSNLLMNMHYCVRSTYTMEVRQYTDTRISDRSWHPLAHCRNWIVSKFNPTWYKRIWQPQETPYQGGLYPGRCSCKLSAMASQDKCIYTRVIHISPSTIESTEQPRNTPLAFNGTAWPTPWKWLMLYL